MRDQTVVITYDGDSVGVGGCAARMFCQNGARVVVVGRHVASGHRLIADIRALGGEATFIDADLTDVVDMGRALDSVGAIDVLVNNADTFALGAGRSLRGSPAAPGSHDGWYEKTFAALFFTCAVVPSMIGGGVVVNVNTVPRDEEPGAVYDHSARLENLTRRWSHKWQGQGVRVHSIALTPAAPSPFSPWPAVAPEFIADLVVALAGHNSGVSSGGMISI